MRQIVKECRVHFDCLAGGHKAIASYADEREHRAKPQFVAVDRLDYHALARKPTAAAAQRWQQRPQRGLTVSPVVVYCTSVIDIMFECVEMVV